MRGSPAGMPAGIAGGLPIVPRGQAAQFLANGTGIVWVIEPYLPLTAPCGRQRQRTFLYRGTDGSNLFPPAVSANPCSPIGGVPRLEPEPREGPITESVPLAAKPDGPARRLLRHPVSSATAIWGLRWRGSPAGSHVARRGAAGRPGRHRFVPRLGTLTPSLAGPHRQRRPIAGALKRTQRRVLLN